MAQIKLYEAGNTVIVDNITEGSFHEIESEFIRVRRDEFDSTIYRVYSLELPNYDQRWNLIATGVISDFEKENGDPYTVNEFETLYRSLTVNDNGLASHLADFNNPHQVTKSQVGLGNVPDVDATLRSNHTGTQLASTISDFDAEVSNNTDVTANTAKVSFPEAPNDGQEYVRKNLDWAIATGGGGGGRNNHVLVKTKADLPTPSGGIITLAAHTSYEINGSIVLGTDRIVLSTSNIIYGIDKSDDQLIYTGTGDMITGTNEDVSIRNITIGATGAGSKCFSLTGDGTNIAEISECIFGNSVQVGEITGGMAIAVFRNNLVTGCAEGVDVAGNNDDLFFTDNLFQGFTGTATAIKIATGNYHTIMISRNMFEISATQTGLNIGTITFTGGGFITNNSFEDGGTYLTGIDANSDGWRIPSRSNIGIAGLFETFLTLTLDAYSGGSTYPSFAAVPNTQVIKQASDYEPNATTIKAVLEVNTAYSINGAGTSIYFDLADYNNGTYTQVSGSETNIDYTSLNTEPQYYVQQSAEFTLTPDKAYRPRVARHASAGNPSVYINSAKLIIKVF